MGLTLFFNLCPFTEVTLLLGATFFSNLFVFMEMCVLSSIYFKFPSVFSFHPQYLVPRVDSVWRVYLDSPPVSATLLIYVMLRSIVYHFISNLPAAKETKQSDSHQNNLMKNRVRKVD